MENYFYNMVKRLRINTRLFFIASSFEDANSESLFTACNFFISLRFSSMFCNGLKSVDVDRVKVKVSPYVF